MSNKSYIAKNGRTWIKSKNGKKRLLALVENHIVLQIKRKAKKILLINYIKIKGYLYAKSI